MVTNARCCVSGDTLIVTPSGIKRMGDIVHLIDHPVYVYDPRERKVVSVGVTDTWVRKNNS